MIFAQESFVTSPIGWGHFFSGRKHLTKLHVSCRIKLMGFYSVSNRAPDGRKTARSLYIASELTKFGLESDLL